MREDEPMTDNSISILHELIIIGGIASIASVLVSIHLIFHHLKHYTCPEQQRLIVRILLMVPIYSVDSWFSLRFHDYSIYFDLVRDCYEAYVLYIFFRLLVVYAGGEHRLAVILTSEPPLPHPPPLCCLPKLQLGWGFLRTAKVAILQFVLIKPLCAIIAIVLNNFGLYGDGEWSFDRAYVYLLFIENLSVTVSMYFLVLFYQATHAELEPHKPLGKFLVIKAVLFLSFWQSCLLSGMEYFHFLPDIEGLTTTEQEYVLEDFLICCEMFLISVAHIFVFGYSEFIKSESELEASAEEGEERDPTKPAQNSLCTNFKDVLIQKDVYVDTKQTLALRPKLVRRFTSFFDQQNPAQHLVTGCYVDCRSNYHSSLEHFDTKFAAILSKPPGMIICKANPFHLASAQREFFGRNPTLSNPEISSSDHTSSTATEFATPSSTASAASIIEAPEVAGAHLLELFGTSEGDPLPGDVSDEEEWVMPETLTAMQVERRPIEASPYDMADLHQQLPCDLIESWISAHKLPMMTYRPSKSSRNPKHAIDVLSIHLKKNFHIIPYIFQLRGTGEELLSIAEAINEVRTTTLRNLHLIGELD